MKVVLIFLTVSVLLASSAFGQQSNPDGIIGKPVITLLGGLHTGGGKTTIGENFLNVRRDSDLSGAIFGAEFLFPVSPSVSLIGHIAYDFQKSVFPETADFYHQESKYDMYSFIFGIKFFGK